LAKSQWPALCCRSKKLTSDEEFIENIIAPADLSFIMTWILAFCL
jgi:hypothetical protein